MALTIPSEDRASVAAVKGLSGAATDELIVARASAPLIVDPDELAKRIAPKVPSISVDVLKSVLGALSTLYYIRELAEVKRSRFLADLIDAIQQTPELRIPDKELAKVRTRLDKLLNIELLHTLAKAGRLQRDGEHLYCDSKILSDIRPVFGSRPNVKPGGAVITHTLRLGYHEGSDHDEFHVILDSEDLANLEAVVHRALAKDKTLRGLLKDAKLTDLGV